MIVLSGASASGKTEVSKVLVKKYGITKMITTTTRKMRVGEINGRDYFFVTKEEFLDLLNKGVFVEHTIYNNNYYGSTKDQINDNRCIVIDPIGLKSYIALNMPSVVTFYLESKEETRFKRMLQRGDEPSIANSRITHDRVVFDKQNIPNVDFIIDSENQTIEEVADEVYKDYLKVLKERHLIK